MLKQFQKVIEEMAALEKELEQRERHHAMTQVRVLRGFVQAIMLACMV